jgi:IS605 OrfB family transposase
MSDMTHKYRLKGKRAARLLRRYAWAANQVWNFCVATQRETQNRWRRGSKTSWLTCFDLQKLTSGSSRDLGLNAQSVQSVCDQFVKSRDQHRRCPRFRRSGGSRRSLGWVPFKKQSRQVNSSSVTYLGHTFRFFGAKRRPLLSTVKGGCFVEDALGRWWVCFHVEVADARASGAGEVGIDLGLKHLAVTSDGEKVEALRSYRKWEARLATAQRAGNRRRAKVICAKIANVRRDHLHKASSKIASGNRLIAVGNVSSSKLAKTRMAKSVLDAGWSTFREMLRYKASRHGAKYLEVDERFTTQTCSLCGALPPERPRGIAGLGIREWKCSSCGVIHDRDVNAAKNILALALSAQRPAEESRVAYGR